MKYSIVVDSVACLPASELKKRAIKVLPLCVSIDDEIIVDTTKEKVLTRIYANRRIEQAALIHTIAPTRDEINQFILDRAALYYDNVFFLTIAKEYSPIYYSAADVAAYISEAVEPIRATRGRNSAFIMSCKDTGTLAAGQGLTAIYADNLLKEGISIPLYNSCLDAFVTKVKSFTVVNDAVFMRKQVKAKGNKSVSFATALVANALSIRPIANSQNGETEIKNVKSIGLKKAINRVLNYCIQRSEEGLVAPIINISYAGDINIIKQLPAFKRLKETCLSANIELYLGVMTLGASVNLGPKSLSVGIAPTNQTASP